MTSLATDESILCSATPRPRPSVGTTPTAPVLESPSARQPKEGSVAAAGGPSGGEPMAQTIGTSMTTTEATTRTVGTSSVETVVVGDTPEPREATPTMTEE